MIVPTWALSEITKALYEYNIFLALNIVRKTIVLQTNFSSHHAIQASMLYPSATFDTFYTHSI